MCPLSIRLMTLQLCVLLVSTKKLCLMLCVTPLSDRLARPVSVVPRCLCRQRTLCVRTLTLAVRLCVLFEGRRTTICVPGSVKCPLGLLVVSRKVFTSVVRLTYTASIVGPRNRTALQTVSLVAIELLGSPTQRRTLPLGPLDLRKSNRVMIMPVTQLLTGLMRNMMCLPSRCEQTLQVCLLWDARLMITGMRPRPRTTSGLGLGVSGIGGCVACFRWV